MTCRARYQQGYEEERFEQTVSQNFLCVICTNVLRDPVMCRENQHLYCRGCITQHLAHFQTCPTCMQELTIDTLATAPRAIKNFLSELKIRCDFYGRGCSTFIELENLKSHVKECDFAPVACSNEGCELLVNKRDITLHESALCKQRMLKCDKCAELRQEMDEMKTELSKITNRLDAISNDTPTTWTVFMIVLITVFMISAIRAILNF